MPTAASTPAAASAAASRDRILQAARAQLFAYGYTALTMDELAAELGMSKKTLYVHFPSKDDLVGEILRGFVAEIRASAEALFGDPSLSFTVKLHRFSEAMTKRLRINPHIFRDLQRSAPHMYRQIEELRHRNIPLIFGRLIRQGQAAKMVRDDIDPDFAIEFWRPAIQALMHPDTLERLQLTPDEMFARAINLFFGGLLTPAGRKDHEKHLHP
ncbi:MAG TPA: TetR/AcrR family transcriptional regulator [Opitutaceae bacterium]|nr:TetR/AcrR family transcriptional regulator [Opitutaceae bacterium]HND63196.1 TetR/AcrR family transcriptional regulator [Opitutaceae bacterium]